MAAPDVKDVPDDVAGAYSPAAVKAVAEAEGVPTAPLVQGLRTGEAMILGGAPRPSVPVGFGKGLRAKVGANVGISPKQQDVAVEVEKAVAAVEAGADTVMDLSVMGDIAQLQTRLRSEVEVPICCNPLYETAYTGCVGTSGEAFSVAHLMAVIENQARRGVDSLTIHCGLTRELLCKIKAEKRVIRITSRGGRIMLMFMEATGRENPLYERFDEVLDLLRSERVGISIGNATRSGTIVDAFGELQRSELQIVRDLVERARSAGVSARVEAPIGHVRIEEIAAAVTASKALSGNAPLGALGPLPTDVALGFDHISSAIGAAIAVANGLDFISTISCREHIGVPEREDTVEAVIAGRIAVHAGDLMRLANRGLNLDREMSQARAARDFGTQIELSLVPAVARSLFEDVGDTCTLCGPHCPLRVF